MSEFQIPGLKNALTDLDAFNKKIEQSAKDLLAMAISADKVANSFKDNSGLTTYVEKQKAVKTETDKVQIARERLLNLQKSEAVELAKVNAQISEQVAKNKLLATSENENATSLQKYNAKLLEATKLSKELGAQMALLAIEGKKNTKEYADLEKQFAKASETSKALNDNYRQISKASGDNRALVGSYADELKSSFEILGNGFNDLKNNIASGNITGTITSARTIVSGFGQSAGEATDKTKGMTDGLETSNTTMGKLNETFRYGAKCTVDYFKPSEANTKLFSSGLERMKIGFTGNVEAVKDLTDKQGDLNKTSREGNLLTQVWTRTKLIFAGATGVVSGAFNILKVAIASTGIGLLIIGIASLISFFTQTQTGVDKLNAVLQPLKAIFDGLVGILSTLGGKLVSVFENPKKAMNDLYEFVKQNLINRFSAFAVILDGIVNLDFKKITNGVLQAGTGVENMTGKIANAGKATAGFLSDAVKKGKEIADLTKQIDKDQLKYNANQIAVNDALDAQKLISKDTSKTMKERAVAANEIIRITKENGDQEAKILQLKLRQLQIEQQLKGEKNLTNADKQKTIDLLTQIDDAEDRGKEARLEQSRVISGLAKEERKNAEEADKRELERRKLALDLTINTQKTTLDYIISTYDQEKNTLEDNLSFYSAISLQKQQIAKLEEQKALIGVVKNSIEEKLIRQKTSDDIQKIKLEEKKAIDGILLSGVKYELDLYNYKNQTLIKDGATLTDLIVENEKKRLAEVLRLNIELLQEELGIDDVKLQSKIKTNAKLTKIELDYLTKVKSLQKDFSKNEEALDKNLLNAKLKSVEEEEKASVRKFKLLQKGTLANNLFSLKAEKERLSKERDLYKDNAEKLKDIDDEIAKNKIETEKIVKQNKIQGLRDSLSALITYVGEESAIGKASAIAQTTIDTYQGATRALKDYPAPYSYIVAGLTIANGLVNVARISGIEAFETGTLYAPYTGKAIVDEKGAELRFDSSGKLKSLGSDSGPSVVDIVKGDKIIPADISAIIKQTMFKSYGMTKEEIDYEKIGDQFGKHANKIVDAVKKNRSQFNVNINRNIAERSTFRGSNQ